MNRYISNSTYFETLITQYRERNQPWSTRTRLGKRKRAASPTPYQVEEEVDDTESDDRESDEDDSDATNQQEGMFPLSSPTVRVTRLRLREQRAQAEDEDDLMEVDQYLRACSVSSEDFDVPIPSSSSSPSKRTRSQMNSHSVTRPGTRVRFVSPTKTSCHFSLLQPQPRHSLSYQFSGIFTKICLASC
ncbi:hypothetical protein BT96DRAFT_640015 [Gymnopus androsaceus JB14]|uniref:Uncharacterized protein n=1 Tax=Gymnopus androsaceus JB14 TaxID=1447944 RepID=A0A6A4HSK7_9AGAR|nr:hypothetical protein BT96DRAFT_640015 [Gymnopus androsaceus JB14]